MNEVKKLEDGQVVNRYKIVKFLGEGGLAYNYLAQMLKPPHIRVVLKQTKRTVELDGTYSEDRFQMEREYRLLSELDNRGIPKVFEIFEIDDVLYFSREYREGTLLSNMIKNKNDQLSFEEIIRQILDIMEYLHNKGIVYRDLKPENVLIKEENEIYLFDFGTARFHKSGKSKDTIALGTPGFAAPEQYGKKQTDQRADIYSFGALLYYIMTGENPESRPFEIGTKENLKTKIDDDSFVQLIGKCLELDPDKRYQTIKELKKAVALNSILGFFSTDPLNPATTGNQQRSRNLMKFSGTFTLIMFLCFSIFIYLVLRFDNYSLPSIQSERTEDYYKTAGYYTKKEKWRNALYYFKKAEEANCREKDLKKKMAEVYYHRGKYADALNYIVYYMYNYGEDYDSLILKSKIYNKMGRFEDSLKILDEISKGKILHAQDLKKPDFFYLKGIIYYNSEKFEESRESFEKAIELSEEFNYEYLNRLALTYMATGDYKKARELLGSSLDKVRGRNSAYIILNWLFVFNDKENQMIVVLKNWIPSELFSDQHCIKAFIYFKNKRMISAYKELQIARSINPYNPQVYYLLALYFSKKKDKFGCSSNLKTARELDVNRNTRILFRQALKHTTSAKVKKTLKELVELMDRKESSKENGEKSGNNIKSSASLGNDLIKLSSDSAICK